MAFFPAGDASTELLLYLNSSCKTQQWVFSSSGHRRRMRCARCPSSCLTTRLAGAAEGSGFEHALRESRFAFCTSTCNP
jgi:hypothetical protein